LTKTLQLTRVMIGCMLRTV